MRPREHFTQQLEALHIELRALGELVVAAITRAIDALAAQNVAAARSIVTDDQHVDRAQYALEEQAVAIIATQQPVASDLRQIIAAIAIASELERIADYAKGIAKLTIRDAERPHVPIASDDGVQSHFGQIPWNNRAGGRIIEMFGNRH